MAVNLVRGSIAIIAMRVALLVLAALPTLVMLGSAIAAEPARRPYFTDVEGRLPIERLIPSLVPLYFGRVAGFVIETRDLTTDQAETIVERQARAFELAKPGFVERWRASASTDRARPAKRAKSTPRRSSARQTATR